MSTERHGRTNRTPWSVHLRVVVTMCDGVGAESAKDALLCLRVWIKATEKVSDRLEDDACRGRPGSARNDRFLLTYSVRDL